MLNLVVNVSRHSAPGPVCSDPGRPADGTQIATSYEIGKTVTFTCNRTGFVPEPSSLTCESKDNGAKAEWNDTHPSRCVGKCFRAGQPMLVTEDVIFLLPY